MDRYLCVLPLLGVYLTVRAVTRVGRGLAPRRRAVVPVIVYSAECVPALARDGLPADPEDRFETMANLYGRSDDDVLTMMHHTWSDFRLRFLGTAALGAWACAAHGLLAVLCVPWSVVLACLTAAAALEHYQLRTRRICGWSEFLRQPGQWWPPSPDADKPALPPGLPLSWRIRRVKHRLQHLAFRVGQIPRRLAARFFRALPPAPPGTPRLTYAPATCLKLEG